MSLNEMWKWVLGLFGVAPWWLKIIIILFIIGIPISIFQKIQEIVGYIVGKTKIAIQMKSSPELALQTAINNLKLDSLTLKDYESHLIKIAESTGYIDAMKKLTELYSGKKYEYYKNEEKCRLWNGRAAKAGDVESIKDYYGFLDYDVSSSAYNEIIQDLDHARTTTTSEDKKAIASYLKGIVNYKMGKIDVAKQLFASLSFPEVAVKSKYMLFRCFVKETNIIAAEKMLDELEFEQFEVPAGDYLSLYNYYVAQRDGAEQNYIAEMRYVVKYAASKDADIKTITQIGGNTYYNVAISLQNGNNGFERDMEKALEAYEKAADFENIEALYYLGKSYWSGENIHNYHRANEYLSKAAQKGHIHAKKILTQYGVEGIIVKLPQAEKTIYSFLDGYELAASGNTMKWLQLHYGIQYKENLIATAFSNTYTKTFKSFDQMINGIHTLYADHVAQMLQWSIQLLMSFGIDMYRATDLIEECEDLSLLPRVPLFEKGLDSIDNRATQLNIQTAYAKSTRGTWSGAGFGTTIGSTINASVQATVAAGVMNVGSGILHGIGDSIVKAMDNSEIKGMGNKLFENHNTDKEFRNAVLTACFDIANVVRSMIEKHCNIKLEKLDGSIIFGSEKLSEIDDRTLGAKIENNMSAQKYEYAYALLVERLRRRPLNTDTFEQIAALTIRKNQSFTGKEYESILRYAGDFRLDTQNLNAILNRIISGD